MSTPVSNVATIKYLNLCISNFKVFVVVIYFNMSIIQSLNCGQSTWCYREQVIIVGLNRFLSIGSAKYLEKMSCCAKIKICGYKL
jgi:hypothetical protein